MTAANRYCWARSLATASGVFRCTLAPGHEGPHRSNHVEWQTESFHFPGCASRLRLHDPGPEAEGGTFDERGWYHPKCDCDQTETAKLLFDAKVKLVKIRDEPRFEFLLPSEADAVIRALDAYAVLLLRANEGMWGEPYGDMPDPLVALLAELEHLREALREIAEFDIGVRLAPVAACKEIARAALGGDHA